MDSSLWAAKTGLEAQQTRMTVVSNNLANVNTTGFKKGRVAFEDLMYQNVRQVGALGASDTLLPSGLMVGTGVRVVATEKVNSQGNIQVTSNPLDAAINGRGFFQVSLPDGTTAYSRDGSFKVNAEGQVIVEDKPSVLTTDISCEFRCRQALQRRSLALDQADLLGYHILESYHDFLFSLLTMEVPSHCGSINLAQILNADRIAFQRMAEYTRSGISMRSNGTFPLQEALAVARAHPIFTTSLAPVPKYTARKTSPTITRPNKGKGKGKGAGSVKGVPRDLVGYWTRNKQGQARCYDFNLPKGCCREV
jgi:flagellar basal body rod protein FlgC